MTNDFTLPAYVDVRAIQPASGMSLRALRLHLRKVNVLSVHDRRVSLSLLRDADRGLYEATVERLIQAEIQKSASG